MVEEHAPADPRGGVDVALEHLRDPALEVEGEVAPPPRPHMVGEAVGLQGVEALEVQHRLQGPQVAGSRSITAPISARKADPMEGSAWIASWKAWAIISAGRDGCPSRAATRCATAPSRVGWLRIVATIRERSCGSVRSTSSASSRTPRPDGSQTARSVLVKAGLALMLRARAGWSGVRKGEPFRGCRAAPCPVAPAYSVVPHPPPRSRPGPLQVWSAPRLSPGADEAEPGLDGGRQPSSITGTGMSEVSTWAAARA